MPRNVALCVAPTNMARLFSHFTGTIIETQFGFRQSERRLLHCRSSMGGVAESKGDSRAYAFTLDASLCNKIAGSKRSSPLIPFFEDGLPPVRKRRNTFSERMPSSNSGGPVNTIKRAAYNLLSAPILPLSCKPYQPTHAWGLPCTYESWQQDRREQSTRYLSSDMRILGHSHRTGLNEP